MRDAINWLKVERLMLKSFTGGAMTDAEQACLVQAWSRSPTEYGTRSRKIRYAEVKRRQRDGV